MAECCDLDISILCAVRIHAVCHIRGNRLTVAVLLRARLVFLPCIGNGFNRCINILRIFQI